MMLAQTFWLLAPATCENIAPNLRGKTMRTILIAAGILVATVAPSSSAQDGAEDILSKVINAPPPAADRVDGSAGKIRNDPSVQGGKALRVEVSGKSDHTWAVSVSNPINKPVKAGDTL